jgi:hypothetical protein
VSSGQGDIRQGRGLTCAPCPVVRHMGMSGSSAGAGDIGTLNRRVMLGGRREARVDEATDDHVD